MVARLKDYHINAGDAERNSAPITGYQSIITAQEEHSILPVDRQNVIATRRDGILTLKMMITP